MTSMRNPCLKTLSPDDKPNHSSQCAENDFEGATSHAYFLVARDHGMCPIDSLDIFSKFDVRFHPIFPTWPCLLILFGGLCLQTWILRQA